MIKNKQATAGVTLLQDWRLLVMWNCWGNMFMALKRTVEHGGGHCDIKLLG